MAHRIIIAGNNAEMPQDAAQQVWAAYRSRINDWINAPIGLPVIDLTRRCRWTHVDPECEPCPICGG